MKNKILFVCMVLFSTQVYAQQEPIKFDYYATSTLDSIGATAGQKAKVMELVKHYKPQRSAIWRDKSLTDEQRKVKLKAINRAQSKEYNALLTADQKKKLQAYKERFDQRHQKQ